MDPKQRERRRRETRARVERDGKYCRGPCQRLRSAIDFAVKDAAVDGRQSWCRDCTAGSLKKHREKYPTRAADNKRARYTLDPERHREKSRKWREANPEKVRQIALRSQRVNAWASNLISHCRYRTKLNGWPPCDLTAEYVLALFEQQGGRCHWLGIPMVPSVATRDPRRPSLDRIVTPLGYVKGNVVLSTTFANMGRSALDAEQFEAFVAELKEHFRT